jgi:hypothetical protein
MSKSQMKTMFITFFHFRSFVKFEFILEDQTVNQTYCVKYWSGCMKLRVGKVLNFGWMLGFSTITVLQLTRCSLSSSFWPKNLLLKYNTKPVPWFGSEWLLAVSRNKIYLQGTKISRYWRHPKRIWRRDYKLFRDRSCKNISDINSVVGPST